MKMLQIGIAGMLLTGCGRTSESASSELIFGGREAVDSDEALKHTVAIVNKDFETFCSGTLITPYHVLTAAHCIEGIDDGAPLFVAFGKNTTQDDGQIKQLAFVAIATKHKDFKTDIEVEGRMQEYFAAGEAINDIALLQLSKKAPKEYSPARRLSGNGIPEGVEVTLAGYGLTQLDPITRYQRSRPVGAKEEPSPEDMERLRQEVANYKPDVGVLRLTTSAVVARSPSKEIVIGGSDTGVCNGDSGGPAFATATVDGHDEPQIFLVGVASRSDCVKIAFHTEVSGFDEWIVETGKSQIARVKDIKGGTLIESR